MKVGKHSDQFVVRVPLSLLVSFRVLFGFYWPTTLYVPNNKWTAGEHPGEFATKELAPSLKLIQSKSGATRRGNIGSTDQKHGSKRKLKLNQRVVDMLWLTHLLYQTRTKNYCVHRLSEGLTK